MGHRLLLQRLPAAWNCSFIQYGKQVAGAAPAIVASYQPWQNCARAYTESGCLLCASICVRNQDTGQRNSVPPTAPLNNQQNDPVVYLHFGELAQCLYLHCLRSTITEPPAVYPHASTAAVPTCVASRRLPAVDMYLHACSGELAQHLPALPLLDNPSPAVYLHTYKSEIPQPYKRCLLSTPVLDAYRHEHPCELAQLLPGVASHRQAVLDKYMHTWSVKLAQCIPVLPPADNRSQLCRASWHSAHWRCILLTTGPGCVPARILGRARSQPTNAASCQQAALDADLHEYPGDLAQRLPALTPIDQQTWTCICRHVRTSWRSACWRCLPVDNRPQLCHASLCSAYRHCLLLTTGPSCVPARILGELCSPPYRHCPLLTIGPGHVPARIPGRAGAGLPALPLVKRPLTCTCIRASASWCSTYRRCVLLTIGSN